ncbi:unnamed protein product [Parascedosporium putredinis]|uniref:Mid2 domain-containing protein n=1 Tax=Parascedosporium putredinis TaxID=1442378 RepID=A0A9P1H8C6_9PEZI|nr:unnamed protein product [Parascedosporium putredinis]CAI7999284.1 unnamed protein product [Parascedosporium putredinis]
MKNISRGRTGLLFTALLLSLSAQPSQAVPYPRDELHDAGYSYLMPRACVQYCGADNQYCWIYTTTWTETNTFTSTVTHDVPAVAATLLTSGITAGGGGGGGGYATVITTNGQVTTLFSAPFRVTGTGTPSPTGFTSGQDQEDEGDGSGLSPGAIAGIVIGTLAGIGLLFLLCFCLIAKGILGAIFGKKKKKERAQGAYDDNYTRSSRAPSSYFTKKDAHSSWQLEFWRRLQTSQ